MAGTRLEVQSGDVGLAYTDGQTIFVPELDDDALRVGLVVEGALLAAGSLEPRIMVRLNGRATSARRYLTLEAARAVRSLGASAPRGVSDVLSAHWDGRMSESADESLRRSL